MKDAREVEGQKGRIDTLWMHLNFANLLRGLVSSVARIALLYVTLL